MFYGGEIFAHGLQKFLNIRPHEDLHDEGSPWFEPLSGHGEGLLAQLKGTALISENRSCRAGSHIAHNNVERAHFPEPCFKVFRAVENILLHESNLGGKNRPRRLEVTAQHQTLRPHLFGSAKRPGSGGSSEIEHAHAAPENLELAVNLFQLVDTSCRVVLLFCLEEVMVAVFLHALSVFIHAFPPVRMTSTKVDAGTGRKPCAMI